MFGKLSFRLSSLSHTKFFFVRSTSTLVSSQQKHTQFHPTQSDENWVPLTWFSIVSFVVNDSCCFQCCINCNLLHILFISVGFGVSLRSNDFILFYSSLWWGRMRKIICFFRNLNKLRIELREEERQMHRN